MKSMAVRVTLLCLFLAATGVTAYVLWTGESLARRDANAARQFEYSAFAIGHDVLDLRASQQAYVAAGQGDAFWISKTAAALNGLRETFASLRAEATSPEAQSSIDNAASALDDFERMDRRARDYARSGQRLLASDLIFVDGLESTGAMLASLNKARTAEIQARDAALAATRRTEAMALGVAALVSLAVATLLVARPSSAGPVRPDVYLDSADSAPLGMLDLRPALESTPPREEPVAAPVPPMPSLDLDTVASLCTDLARVTDTRALPAILGRAAAVLDAPGIVLWIADPDDLDQRLGTILRDDENVTASAFRTALTQTVEMDAVSNGAIAAPLVTPAGCVGVMAAEVRREGEKDSGKLAAAAIVAAQLATLVGPPSTRAQARADVG